MGMKRHAFVRLNPDLAEFWNSCQLDAAFQLYRAGPRAIEFLEALGHRAGSTSGEQFEPLDGHPNCSVCTGRAFRRFEKAVPADWAGDLCRGEEATILAAGLGCVPMPLGSEAMAASRVIAKG